MRDYSPIFECILVDSLRVKLKKKIMGLIHEGSNAGGVNLAWLEDQIFYELGDIMELSDSGNLAAQEQIRKHLEEL